MKICIENFYFCTEEDKMEIGRRLIQKCEIFTDQLAGFFRLTDILHVRPR
jgi:hypothetical protein